MAFCARSCRPAHSAPLGPDRRGPILGPGQRQCDRCPQRPSVVAAPRGDQHVEPARRARAVTGHFDGDGSRQISRQRAADSGGDLPGGRVVARGITDIQVRHAGACAGEVAVVGHREDLPGFVHPHDHAVAIQQRDLDADIRVGPALAPAAFGQREQRPGVCFLRGQGGGYEGIYGHHTIDAAHGEHTPHDLAADHQPQFRPADQGPLVDAPDGVYARMITGDRIGHVSDQERPRRG